MSSALKAQPLEPTVVSLAKALRTVDGRFVLPKAAVQAHLAELRRLGGAERQAAATALVALASRLHREARELAQAPVEALTRLAAQLLSPQAWRAR